MITRSVAPPTATSSPSRPDDILATLCHDLRTPLAVISRTAQLLARQVKAAKTDPAIFAHELARITRNANRIAVLLDELCDLAHDGAGRPPALTLRPTDLVALTRRVVDEHRVIADGHTIAVASERSTVMSRPHCPRCRGRLFFTVEDDLPCFTCLMCGRSFVPAQASQVSAKAA
ncbi:MAG: sensor histidine kinase [Dehalococcoidia bacterium]